MQTVLIAHSDNRFASALAAALHSAGYHSAICAGAQPPLLSCARLEEGACPLAAEAQVLIYDPDLVGLDHDGRLRRLAVETAYARPGVPLLLAWAGEAEPPSVAVILEQAPEAQRAARERGALVAQIRALVGPPEQLSSR